MLPWHSCSQWLCKPLSRSTVYTAQFESFTRLKHIPVTVGLKCTLNISFHGTLFCAGPFSNLICCIMFVSHFLSMCNLSVQNFYWLQIHGSYLTRLKKSFHSEECLQRILTDPHHSLFNLNHYTPWTDMDIFGTHIYILEFNIVHEQTNLTWILFEIWDVSRQDMHIQNINTKMNNTFHLVKKKTNNKFCT